MINSTKLIGLFMTAAMWAGVAAAQGPGSNWGDDTPPDLTLPTPSVISAGAPNTMMTRGGEESLPSPQTDGYYPPQVDGYDITGPCQYPDVGGYWNEVAPIESTGTWLTRGFWYAEADAVVFTRGWNRDNALFAAEDARVENPGFPPAALNTNRTLYVDGSQPGEDAAVRATLGHFLFRDSLNRDHTVEFTLYGGGQWEQQRVITSQTQFGLFVPFDIDGGNTSFDGSNRQFVEYKTRFKSFEMNYRVRQRLGHDQLVMDPNGGWHRAANAGFEREYLAGLRALQVQDILEWSAQDIAVIGDDGQYNVRTDNDMVGIQAGGGGSYQASRWSVGLFSKGGVFINDATGRTALDFTADDDDDFNLRLKNDELTFILDFKLQSKFHITPNASLRAGYELMYMTSMALAPHQATFIPEFATLNTTGDLFFHGVSFGFEGYW
jgi:hypothetical protein